MTTPAPPNGQATKLYLLLLLASMCTDCSSTYELQQQGCSALCSGGGSRSAARRGVHGDGLGTIKGRHKTLVSTMRLYSSSLLAGSSFQAHLSLGTKMSHDTTHSCSKLYIVYMACFQAMYSYVLQCSFKFRRDVDLELELNIAN